MLLLIFYNCNQMISLRLVNTTPSHRHRDDGPPVDRFTRRAARPTVRKNSTRTRPSPATNRQTRGPCAPVARTYKVESTRASHFATRMHTHSHFITWALAARHASAQTTRDIANVHAVGRTPRTPNATGGCCSCSRTKGPLIVSFAVLCICRYYVGAIVVVAETGVGSGWGASAWQCVSMCVLETLTPQCLLVRKNYSVLWAGLRVYCTLWLHGNVHARSAGFVRQSGGCLLNIHSARI